MKTVSFKAGETILTEGEVGNTAFLIRSGSVKVSIGTRAGAKRLAMLQAGDVFGEMCLLEPGPRSATIVAATDVECVETTYDDFVGSMQDHPQEAIKFMQTLVRRLRQSNELLAKLDPRKRGIGGLIADLRQSMSLESMDMSDEAAIRPYFSW
jgi:CRP/FNR family cyclic AMP-dependent transcriptional regulator